MKLILLLCILGSGIAYADDPEEIPFEIRALRGHPTVSIMVSLTTKTSIGSTDEELSRDIELVLRRNGVPIAPYETSGGALELSLVSINERDLFSMSISLEYSEVVTPWRLMERCPQKEPIAWCKFGGLHSAIMWHRQGVMSMGSNKLNTIHDDVKRYAEQFALDYLRANPPEVKK